ncbi:HPr kinase [Afipia carboxidovorans OM5]|uniref:HprK/P domain protein n=1 Tax=Afipia carboxidovorans (strain ATCC 49405 / DSM 1227 / KCTC 32145 / OM5) TaxID=504832 RepID=B6JJT4_AFIC5|nr:HPr kinase/phosphatase C-terminal domain-containing protein [Afipia carboxidovorans]ACI94678.1 HPr kinase [Afipia carboxidovorans OM5]AEI01715.1 HprK/P domain protein [Afipia carboxidovorans OM4]AEI05290.1 HprK/P domain protein [Afipia carboxidovorans OM5]
MTLPPATVHASAVRVGDRGILIRGASGTGKSRLVLDLILAGRTGAIPPTQLISDDRVRLEVRDGALIAHAVPELAGLIEIRGLGLRHCDYAAQAKIGLVVDLAAPDAERLPPPECLKTLISEVELARIPVEAGYSALPLVLGFLITS